ncbi:MAG: glutathione peroxidase [Bacteroidetes bacterium]|nr:glutathione peroxidase [Bacteroidota bacterium]
MKKILYVLFSGAFILAIKSCVFGKAKLAEPTALAFADSSIYSIQLATLDGKGQINWGDYKGKKILIVNTASECGYTPQYEGLEKLYQKYKESLVIIGCPCNQFGGQEPGDTAEIRNFCSTKYNISFPLSAKLDVKGSNQHPLYAWLTQKDLNKVMDATVKWNFNKFLIDEQGRLIAYFPSSTKPDDAGLISAIEKK